MPTGVFEAMKTFETLIEIKRLRELPTRSLSLVSLRERGVQDSEGRSSVVQPHPSGSGTGPYRAA